MQIFEVWVLDGELLGLDNGSDAGHVGKRGVRHDSKVLNRRSQWCRVVIAMMNKLKRAPVLRIHDLGHDTLGDLLGAPVEMPRIHWLYRSWSQEFHGEKYH